MARVSRPVGLADHHGSGDPCHTPPEFCSPRHAALQLLRLVLNDEDRLRRFRGARGLDVLEHDGVLAASAEVVASDSGKVERQRLVRRSDIVVALGYVLQRVASFGRGWAGVAKRVLRAGLVQRPFPPPPLDFKNLSASCSRDGRPVGCRSGRFRGRGFRAVYAAAPLAPAVLSAR